MRKINAFLWVILGVGNLSAAAYMRWSGDSDWILYSIHGWLFLVLLQLRSMEGL